MIHSNYENILDKNYINKTKNRVVNSPFQNTTPVSVNTQNLLEKIERKMEFERNFELNGFSSNKSNIKISKLDNGFFNIIERKGLFKSSIILNEHFMHFLKTSPFAKKSEGNQPFSEMAILNRNVQEKLKAVLENQQNLNPKLFVRVINILKKLF